MFSDTFNIDADHADVIVNDKPEEIKQGMYGEFWLRYCEAAYNKILQRSEKISGARLNVKQVNLEVTPLIVKIEEMLGKNKLVEIVKKIQDYLKSTFVFDRLSDNDVRCIITNSDTSMTLYFPYCKLVATDIEKVYMSNIENLIKSAGDIKVSRYYARDAVSLYGSTNEIFMVAYEEIGDDVEEDYVINDLSLLDHLHHTKIDQEIMSSNGFKSKQPAEYWLPLILSLDYWRSITKLSTKSNSYRGNLEENKNDYDIFKMISNTPVDDSPLNLDDYLTLIKMWNVNRVVDPLYWKIIGGALHTLENGDSRGLNGWVAIVENALKKATSPNYLTGHNIRKKCADIYDTFISGKITAVSLASYAKIDSPKEYKLWHDKWVDEALLGSLSGTEADVGRVFYRCYWLEYMADVSDTRITWYRYHHHRLLRDHAGISLRSTMSNDLLMLYSKLKSNISEKQRSAAVNVAVCEMVIRLIKKIIESLGKQRYKRNLLVELSERFRVENILDYIDSDHDITLVKNGVICVIGANIYFREGQPEDYLVKSFDAVYRQDYNWSHPKIQNLLEWSYITFIDRDTITFHWKYLASLLKGGNNDKKIMFWSGPLGNNMKTTWQRFVASILGARCKTMPINYFTMGKGSANGATPAEVGIENCRLMFSDEPDNRIPFLGHILKSESGNDKKQIRQLYGESRDIIPQHKTCIVCNFPPPTSKEGATIERILINEFGSQAVYDAPESRQEQIRQRKFPRNPFFDKELPGLKDAGLWIMCQIWPIYARDGLRNPPQNVIKATEEYWDSVDKYSIFIKEYITNDIQEAIDGFDLYAEFDRWHQKTYRKEDTPDKQTAVKEFSKRLGNIADGVWYGYKLRKR